MEGYSLDGIHLACGPRRADSSALGSLDGRHCIPCGGGFGEIFPCVLCENWAHMGCSYRVEGGRVCASHVAVLDAAQGLAVIVSDPSGRLEGTILRPTAVFGKATSKPKKSRVGNNWESRDTEGQRFWELIAMYKAIWLAAGLAYDHGQEATGVEMLKNERGSVERITPTRLRLRTCRIRQLGLPLEECHELFSWRRLPRTSATTSTHPNKTLEIEAFSADGNSVTLLISTDECSKQQLQLV
eukprot:3248114-Amphidinium_carterae.3